ncbi:MAG: ABC transporter ATP-binding protein [Pseudomonadota bacterium]
MSEPILKAQDLVFGYEANATILNDLSVTLPSQKITALVGPNGCGKSTLLSLLAGIETAQSGNIHLKGQEMSSYTSKERAIILGLLPQAPEVTPGVLVSELLALGRVPHRTFFEPWRAEDQTALEEAAKAAGVDQMLGRPVEQLSGGQRQRAFIAMALTQAPEVLLLDEPTSSLDIAQQFAILNLLRERVRSHGLTAVVAIHDIAQAGQFADHIVVMKAGKVHDQGSPEEIVTAQLFKEVFDVTVRVLVDEETGHRSTVPTWISE